MESDLCGLVVYAWNGSEEPLKLVRKDASPQFSLLIFDYSGRSGLSEYSGWPVLSRATECKGEIYREVYRHMLGSQQRYDYVGLIDDDIELSWSDINRLLAIGREHGLDIFQPSLTPDSHYSHKCFLNPGRPGVRPSPWIEVMMPFYRSELFLSGGPYYAESISSWGLDQFVMPMLQKLMGMNKAAIIDSVVVRHGRPITSDDKVFSNGLTAHQERVRHWVAARLQIARERPDLLASRWYFQTFAPLNGHHRHWPLWLIAPLLWLQGTLARRRLSKLQPAE